MVARAGKPIQTHASTRASAQEHLAVMREAVTDRRIHAQTQAQMAAMGQEGGNSSADQGSSSASGSAGQRAAAAHGPKSAQAMLADTKASLVNTKIHIQTQHEQAAFGYDGANARGDNDADRNDSTASHSSAGSDANQGVVIARGGGDVAGDNFEGGSSAAPVSTAHGSAPQRAGMPSPNALNAPARLHLNANQSQQLTSSRPSEEMGNDREVGSHVGAASSSGSFRAETTSFRAPEPRQASFVREHADHFKMPASRYH
jgi:hypothetical protein